MEGESDAAIARAQKSGNLCVMPVQGHAYSNKERQTDSVTVCVEEFRLGLLVLGLGAR